MIGASRDDLPSRQRVRVCAAFASALVALSGCDFSHSDRPQYAIDSGRDAVRALLGVPQSGLFRNEIVVGAGDRRIVCGEVNGKNVLGVYVGFRPYAYSPKDDRAIVYVDPDPGLAIRTAVAAPAFPSACMHRTDPTAEQ